MKKFLVLILILAIMLTTTACATVNADGTPTVYGVAIEQSLNVAAKLLEALVAIFAAWALKMIGKRKELQNTQSALSILFDLVRQTVGELQQLVVDDAKALAEDGKLSEAQVYELNAKLHEIVHRKLDTATEDLLVSAGMDINALITGAAEDWINRWKLTPELITYNADIGTNLDYPSGNPAVENGAE